MKILVFAPHNDDEVLGPGGTIAKYVKEGHELTICEVTSGPKYKMMQEEARKAHAVLGASRSVFLNLPYRELVDIKLIDLNAKIDGVVKEIRPDIVFTPFIGDLHFDHRMVTEAVLVACRPINNCSVRKLYMYETLSETGWNTPSENNSFIPNVWIDISGSLEQKIEAMKCYQSQIQKWPHPRSEEGMRALAAYRGSTVGVGYAESFMLVREIG